MSNPGSPPLALYYYYACPFCRVVLNAIKRLDIEVELRDTMADPQHRQDLMAARGRGTVPVLRIQQPEGDEWMPESRDIVRYLEGLAKGHPKPRSI